MVVVCLVEEENPNQYLKVGSIIGFGDLYMNLRQPSARYLLSILFFASSAEASAEDILLLPAA